MKLLQNKSTGEIGCLVCSFGKTPEKITVVEYIGGKRGSRVWYYNSLAELNEEWEDYEEPKWLRDYWFIDSCGGINKQESDILGVNRREIGNYFNTKEEAEKAVEKLKAWKRLKDRGFKFKDFIREDACNITISVTCDECWSEIYDDLDLLFGGEE